MTSTKRTASNQLAYRFNVAVRTLTATLGAYVLTAMIVVLMGRVLPGSQAQAVLAAMLLSFLVMTVLVIAVFSIRSLPRLLTGLLMLAAGLWLALQLTA